MFNPDQTGEYHQNEPCAPQHKLPMAAGLASILRRYPHSTLGHRHIWKQLRIIHLMESKVYFVHGYLKFRFSEQWNLQILLGVMTERGGSEFFIYLFTSPSDFQILKKMRIMAETFPGISADNFCTKHLIYTYLQKIKLFLWKCCRKNFWMEEEIDG